MKTFPAAALALVMAGSVALTGCTSKTSTPTPSTPAPKVSTTPLPPDPSWKGTPGGFAKDLKVSECGLEPGTQKARGTITNSTDRQADYSILIMWMKNNDSTPYGSGRVIVKALKPGETRERTVETNVPTKVDTCVRQVLAGELA